MAPMKEMFRQIGGVYTEDGDKIAITMNGDTLEMTVGSRDVIFNGVKESGALESGQEPEKGKCPGYRLQYLSGRGI